MRLLLFFLLLLITLYISILIGSVVGNIFFTAALGSTITCIGIPFVFLFTGTLWGLSFSWPLVFYLFGKRFRTGFAIRDSGKKDKVTYKKLAVMVKVTAYYIYLSLFPTKLAFFREFGFDFQRKPKVQKELESFNKNFWVAA